MRLLVILGVVSLVWAVLGGITIEVFSLPGPPLPYVAAGVLSVPLVITPLSIAIEALLERTWR